MNLIPNVQVDLRVANALQAACKAAMPPAVIQWPISRATLFLNRLYRGMQLPSDA